jgi:hypothetical protein
MYEIEYKIGGNIISDGSWIAFRMRCESIKSDKENKLMILK